MHLDPTWSRRDCLSIVIASPALHNAESNGAHPRELVDRLEALVDRRGQLVGEILIVEDAHFAAWWDLADRLRMPAEPHVN